MKVTINGKDYYPSEDKPLVTYLREDLGITSVKNGCDQGACGACQEFYEGYS